MKTVLTIAGSDCSGGAGIQADLKTMTAYGVYGMSAVTALTAQNTTGVFGVLETPPDLLAAQLDCIFADIPPDAVKVGMTGSASLIERIGEKLRQHHVQNLVLDPVMVSTSGRSLLPREGLEALTGLLFPLASLVTPNLPEAQVLCGWEISTEEQMEQAACQLGKKYGVSVLLKGGHRSEGANDLLYHRGNLYWFSGERVKNPNTHGTGCTLSSAIACGLALGEELPEAVKKGKDYLTQALKAGLRLGKGNGPLNHMVK